MRSLSRSSTVLLCIFISVIIPFVYRFFFSAPDPNARYFLAAYHGNLVELQQLYVQARESSPSSPALPRVNLLDLRDRWNNSLLHWSSKSSSPLNIQTLDFLLNSVQPPLAPLLTQPNSAGSYPLHWSVYSDSESMITLLVDSGAPINATNLQGESALHWAVHWQKPTAVKTLLKLGIDREAQDSYGNSAAHKLPEDCLQLSSCSSILSILLQEGFNVKVENHAKRTPLMRIQGIEKDESIKKRIGELEESWKSKHPIKENEKVEMSKQQQKKIDQEIKQFHNELEENYNLV
jgi:hypothetical protein